MSDRLLCWLAVYHTAELGHAAYSQLLQSLGSAEAILGSSSAQLTALGLAPHQAAAVLDSMRPGGRAHELAAADLQWASGDHCSIITLQDEHYPTLLREIDCPPPLLFARGLSRVLKMPQIAVVGSRNCSMSGREVAAMFSRQLGSAGLSICSGLASGIDTAAHTASVSANLPTVAVLGNGIDSIYPSRNAKLAAQIGDCGVLVSEFPRGSPPRPEHFPRRNRIISGISLGVLVVEAAMRSGSLITARLAMEQNREVFAVPGSIRTPHSRGCHHLIRQGAQLVETPEEILAACASLLDFQLQGLDQNDCVAFTAAASGSASENLVLASLDDDPLSMDGLLSRTRLPLPQLCEALAQLELRLQIALRPGGYVRCNTGR